ncbi:MAG: hypothetical protein H5T84_07315 [Thermoleophilia bacterium]|nr:hypothetical protein [Thermoleophilia bacterium]
MLSNREEGFVYPLFEFVAAPPEIGLREPLAQHQRSAIAALAAIVEEGKTQGVIRPEVDAEQAAWELVGVYWAVDVAYLMGLEDFVTSGRSVTMLERVLGAISAETSSA